MSRSSTPILRTVVVLLLAAALHAPTASAEEPKLENDDHKTVYALGVAMSGQLGQFDLSDAEIGILAAGLRDGLKGDEPRVDMQAFGPKISGLAEARAAKMANVEKTASAEFLKKAKAEKGAVTTDSGVVYLETQTGTGEQPKAENVVKVHYHGTLRDGSVFDSSVERGEPATFPLGRVIPCWTEAVGMMRVGGKATITCPSDVAYGDQGKGQIKPGATLRFDVELISIEN